MTEASPSLLVSYPRQHSSPNLIYSLCNLTQKLDMKEPTLHGTWSSYPNPVLSYRTSYQLPMFSSSQTSITGWQGGVLGKGIPELWFGGQGPEWGCWGLKVSLANWSAPWGVFPQAYAPIRDARVYFNCCYCCYSYLSCPLWLQSSPCLALGPVPLAFPVGRRGQVTHNQVFWSPPPSLRPRGGKSGSDPTGLTDHPFPDPTASPNFPYVPAPSYSILSLRQGPAILTEVT